MRQLNSNIKTTLLKALVCMLSVLLYCSSVLAHPHNWIALNSSFMLDEDARLVQLKQRWEFDIYYSMMTLADVLNEHGNEEIGLTKTASEMIKNLAEHDYLSRLSVDGINVPLSMPKNYSLITKTKEGQVVLELEMVFDLAEPLLIENKALAWQVFDPTYYIAMNHATESNIEIIGGNATECSKELRFPDPPDDMVDYAQSLDKSQTDTDGLGESFAETAFINCY